MDLQTVFYVLGIIFMVVMLLLVLGILIAVLIIKSKINAFHRTVNEKVDMIKRTTKYISKIVHVFRPSDLY